MLLLALLFIPLFSAIFLQILGGQFVKKIALLLSLIPLGISIYLAANSFCPCMAEMSSFDKVWIQSLGVNFSLKLDGTSLLLVLLTNTLIPLIILTGFNYNYSNESRLFALISAMQFGLLGVFLSNDAFLFYVFWEIALIPVYFICGIYGGYDKERVTLKFFIYTILGSLFMLVGILYVYSQMGIHADFSIESMIRTGVSLSLTEQTFVFIMFLLAFAIKMPIFPLHTWQPDTYTVSPTVGTMLLSGIMLKMGVFGAMKWLKPISPLAFEQYSGIVVILSVIGIVYASILAIQQSDAKKLVAYSSIAHVGLIAAGVFVNSSAGLEGATIQMINHGINVVGMFFVLDVIERRMNTREIASLGGIINKAPLFAVFYVIIMLGNVALPLTNGFVGEFILLKSLFDYSAWLAFAAGLSVILGAVYSLRTYQRVMLGETNSLTEQFTCLNSTEIVVLSIISALVIILGIFPSLILQFV
ncbi:MAG: NADH-quinone oxidoreductase subunit M [Cytophagales bacterium]